MHPKPVFTFSVTGAVNFFALFIRRFVQPHIDAALWRRNADLHIGARCTFLIGPNPSNLFESQSDALTTFVCSYSTVTSSITVPSASLIDGLAGCCEETKTMASNSNAAGMMKTHFQYFIRWIAKWFGRRCFALQHGFQSESPTAIPRCRPVGSLL